jgi:uncharacterized protein with PIN domain
VSKKLQRKHDKCMICQKEIKKTTAHLPMFDYILNEMYEVPFENYVCSGCLCVYDKNMNLVGINKSFIMEYGEA